MRCSLRPGALWSHHRLSTLGFLGHWMHLPGIQALSSIHYKEYRNFRDEQPIISDLPEKKKSKRHNAVVAVRMTAICNTSSVSVQGGGNKSTSFSPTNLIMRAMEYYIIHVCSPHLSLYYPQMCINYRSGTVSIVNRLSYWYQPWEQGNYLYLLKRYPYHALLLKLLWGDIAFEGAH